MMPMSMFMYAFAGILGAGALIVVAWFGVNAFRKLSGSAAVLIAGLILMFLGERVFGFSDWRPAVTGAGSAIVLGGVALRAWAFSQSTGARREGHRLALIASGGVLVGLVIYALSLDTVLGSLPEESRGKAHVVLTCAWPILIACSLFPIVGLDRLLSVHPVELPLGAARRTVINGISAALGICLVVPINYLAAMHTHEWDTAYFRTTQPGSSTLAMVATFSSPVNAVVLLPAGSDVGREVAPYFDGLASASGGQFTWEAIDQALDPKRAEELKIRENGYIAFQQGDKIEKFKVGTDLEKSKRELKKLDATVQKNLMKLTRGQRTVYLTTGHGELNTREKDDAFRKLNTFKKVLETQNYTIKNLGLTEGLSTAVPDDAAAVVIAGPDGAFMPEEVATLQKYWEGGGHLLVLAERGADPPENLDPILGFLGLKAGRDLLVNAAAYASQGHGIADRELLATNRFGSHDSVKTLSKNSTSLYIVTPGAVSIEKVADTKNKVTTLVRSMPATWADLDGDHEKGPNEAEKVFELASAVSPPEGGGEGRAIAVGDATLLSDPLLTGVKGNVVFAYDVLRWLVGDEDVAGEVESEEDVKIVHTREENQYWFYGTTALVPLLVLGFGVLFVGMRRGRKK
jgi:hypothetical protein